jgi:segregation and condensation protein B
MSKRKTARFLRAAYLQMLRAARELTQVHLEGRIEALVFAAPLPMNLRDIARATGARRNEIEKALADLVTTYAERGIQLVETSEGFAFLTNPLFGEEVRAITGKKPVRMSRAQLETLAVIAYRQPVTRPEIDDVRGVDSGPVLRTLLDRELIRVIGKKEEPGRPLLYGTTDEFLKLVHIKSLAELPTLREFTELSDDSRDTYERKLGEAAPAGAIVFDDEPDDLIDPTADDEDDEDRGSDAPGREAARDGDLEEGDDDEGLDDDDEDLDDDDEGLDDDADGLEDDDDADDLEEADDEDLDDDEEEDLDDEEEDLDDEDEDDLDDDSTPT